MNWFIETIKASVKGADKQKHFFAGIIIAALAFSFVYGLLSGFSAPINIKLILALRFAFITGLAAAFTKELVDKYFRDTFFSWPDIFATTYGVLLFTIPATIFILIS